MRLSELPPDIQVLILSHLDFPSLVHLVSTHSSFNSVWKSYPEHLSRAICLRNGLADSKTVGSAAPLQAEGWHEKGGLDKEPTEDELREVIREQRSMTGAFDGVTSWKEYARRSRRINQNWKLGKFEETEIKLDMSPARPEGFGTRGEIWRFKIDPISGWIVATGLLGGVRAFDMNGKLVWSATIPNTPYGHLESTYTDSTSYLCTLLSAGWFLVWRYHDPTRSQDPPPTINITPNDLATLNSHVTFFGNNKRGYYPFTLVGSDGASFRASKLRFPYIIASTGDNTRLYEFNFTVTKSRPKVLNLSTEMEDQGGVDMMSNGESEVTYLELDDSSRFVGGMRSIQVYRINSLNVPESSENISHAPWPPEAPPGYRYLQPLIPRPLYRENGVHLRPWSAVHHDSKSQYLVGVSSVDSHSHEDRCSILSITYQYKSAVFWASKGLPQYDREDIEQRTMNLRFDGVNAISQLSVENDRAVFITSTHFGHALFLLPLRPFKTLAEFVANPPQPICLSFPFPCFEDPQRIEMTSTDIFVPICTPFVRVFAYRLLSELYRQQERYWKSLPFKYPHPMKWQTLDGQTLINYEKDCLPIKSSETNRLCELRENVEQAALSSDVEAERCMSSLLRFSFDC